ncbi:hypothetical protein E2C01_038088 [Portunus trituberculatus]|uniref:Transmembrane protein n=1 Tax=Portunus trituberculatus TaxID=210409 RepID=A0A5B7FFV3_PORTR|nr:hypothetical protein [Portunus trituberculatus]
MAKLDSKLFDRCSTPINDCLLLGCREKNHLKMIDDILVISLVVVMVVSVTLVRDIQELPNLYR